ncbi:MAG: RpiB/LacA/LacB family sugar-phosphate isomerase [Parcubacteria group bacterium]|nr:RpiB/LacA/LacB family sugar-phosphate isomerase [Parcubacteria group bacterium]
MKIYLAGDHAGFALKEEIRQHLMGRGFSVQDFGPASLDPDDDYPDFVVPLAKKVAEEKKSRGVVIGGSGQGEAMVANKVKGIRAVVYYGGSLDIVRLSCQHNDANVLALGARFITKEEAIDAVTLWLETEFEGGRHERRLKKIEAI